MINRIDPVPNELAVRKLGTDSVQIGLADSVKAILNRPEVVLPEPTDLSAVLARISALENAIQEVPPGLIAMWSGLLVNIPLGWVLCDGTNGTPDLREAFIKGSAAGIDPGVTGGANTHTHDDHATHTHDIDSSLATSDLFSPDVTATGVSGRTGGPSATLTHSVASNEPVYFSLAFIMKL